MSNNTNPATQGYGAGEVVVTNCGTMFTDVASASLAISQYWRPHNAGVRTEQRLGQWVMNTYLNKREDGRLWNEHRHVCCQTYIVENCVEDV